MTGYEFKELAGLVLQTKGSIVCSGYPHERMCYDDQKVKIEGIYNLKQLQVTKYLEKQPFLTGTTHVLESVGRKIKFYREDEALILHLKSITVLEQLARL